MTSTPCRHCGDTGRETGKLREGTLWSRVCGCGRIASLADGSEAEKAQRGDLNVREEDDAA